MEEIRVIIFLRHGQDPLGFRGGWSSYGLTEEGVLQAHNVGKKLMEFRIDLIISSDLERAKQTTKIISKYCEAPVLFDADWREINNGRLAGMPNDLAEILFPGVYYNTLEMNEKYPDGESPNDFFSRIEKAYSKIAGIDKNILVVTHSGVISVCCSLRTPPFSNKDRRFQVGVGEFIVFD